MKGYLIVNAFLKSAAFDKLYLSLTAAFSRRGKELRVLTNAEAPYALPEKAERGDFTLFFDKDAILCRLLEKRGYRSFNCAYTIEVCDDKAKTFAALYGGDIAMPETVLAPMTFSNVGYTDYAFLQQAETRLGFPMIVKENVGSFGMQVRLAHSRAELESAAREIGAKGFLMQKFVSESRGRDLRVYVVGGKVRASAIRENPVDFRSNYALGGAMTAFTPSDAYIDAALKACAAVKADFAGVDLLFGEKGPILCEINSNAHFQGISKACGEDVASDIAAYCIETAQKTADCER